MTTNHTTQSKTKDEQPVDPFAVRMKLYERHHTMASWADAHQVHRATLYNAIRGIRRGPYSRRIVHTLRLELGL
jgi:hypothetical protein